MGKPKRWTRPTPLMAAAGKGNLREVRRLLQAGADVDAFAIEKGSAQEANALTLAVKSGHLEVVRILLAAGADPRGAVAHGNRALVEACRGCCEAYWRAYPDDEFFLVSPEERQQAQKTHNCYLEIARELLRAGAVPDEGQLAHAANFGMVELIRLLLEAGVDVHEPDGYGEAPVTNAAAFGHAQTVAALLEAGARRSDMEAGLAKGLHDALQRDARGRLRRLLQIGANPNLRSKDGQVPLLSLVSAGDLDLVRELLARGADPNARGPAVCGDDRREGLRVRYVKHWSPPPKSRETTALIVAVRRGFKELVDLLLAAGADLALTDEEGLTAMAWAQQLGRTELVERLEKAGAAQPTSLDGSLDSTLLRAAEAGDAERLKALIARGADVHFLLLHPKGERTALALAAEKGHVEAVGVLLQAGARADQALRSPKGDTETPLALAAAEGHAPTVRRLLEAGANPSPTTLDGTTPLMTAAAAGHADVVQELLRGGADANAKNWEGETALDAAVAERKTAVARHLKEAGGKRGRELRTIPRPGPRRRRPASRCPEPPPPRDFSDAAAQPGFQEALRRVAKACGRKANPLRDIDGGYCFSTGAAKAEKVLAALHGELLAQGVYLFRVETHHGSTLPDILALLPTADRALVIRAIGTGGPNYYVSTADVVAWLEELEKEQPFELTGIGNDFLEGRFTTPVRDPEGLAARMYQFCPDIVDQGIGTVEALAQDLREHGRMFFWWD